MYPNDPRDRRGRDDNRTRAYDRDAYRDDSGYSGYGGDTAYSQQPYGKDPYAGSYGQGSHAGGYQRETYPDAYRDAGSAGRRKSSARSGPRINIGLFIGGIAATAVVTALAAWLVAWIIRVVSQRVTETGKLGVWNPVAQDEYWFAVVGALCAVLAGALWYVLQLTTPSPDQFFMWIVGLLLVAAVVLPLLLSREISAGIGTAIMHLVIGLPILFLVSAMGAKSIEHR